MRVLKYPINSWLVGSFPWQKPLLLIPFVSSNSASSSVSSKKVIRYMLYFLHVFLRTKLVDGGAIGGSSSLWNGSASPKSSMRSATALLSHIAASPDVVFGGDGGSSLLPLLLLSPQLLKYSSQSTPHRLGDFSAIDFSHRPLYKNHVREMHFILFSPKGMVTDTIDYLLVCTSILYIYSANMRSTYASKLF